MHSIRQHVRASHSMRVLVAITAVFITAALIMVGSPTPPVQAQDVSSDQANTSHFIEEGDQDGKYQSGEDSLKELGQNLANGGNISDKDQDTLRGITNQSAGNDPQAMQRIIDAIGETNLDKIISDDNIRKQFQGNEQLINALDQLGTLQQASQLMRGQGLDIGQALNNVTSGGNAGGGSSSAAYPLNGGHTYSDLLASVLFSQSSDQAKMDSKDLSMADLASYPSDDDNEQTYGNLQSPTSNNETDVGSKLANYIRGLYKYQWIVGIKPKNNGEPNTDEAGGQGGKISGALMKVGTMGAHVYDLVSGMIKWSSEAFSNFNLVRLFNISNDDAGQEHDNFVTQWVGNTLESSGLNSSFRAVRFIAATLIGTGFIIVLMRVISQSKGKATLQDGKVRSLGTRIIVIVLAVPFAAVFTSTVDSMTDKYTKNNFNSASDINANYVVDTLAFAAGSNLNTAIGGAPIGGGTDSFDPSKVNIETIMHYSAARLNESGSKYEQGNAASLMEAYSNKSTSNIDDYTSIISSSKNGKSNIAASRAPGTSGAATISSDNHTEMGDGATMLQVPYFFSMKAEDIDDDDSSDKSDDSSSDSSNSSDSPSSDSSDSPSSDSSEENKDDKKDSDKKDSDKKDDNKKDDNKTQEEAGRANSSLHNISHGMRLYADDGDKKDDNKAKDDDKKDKKITLYGRGNTNEQQEFKCSVMTCDAVRWNKPGTYIFGGIKSENASREQADLANFAALPNSHQKYDPEGGEEGKSDKKKILEANDVSIAVMNRYAGTSEIEGGRSLNTQSTAFLLQSTFDNDTLHYKGKNTIPNPFSAGKLTGSNGNYFLRYTIPNTGGADLASKISALVAMWVCAGIISVIALFALFRSPVFAAIGNMFKGFFQGVATGNIGGLLKYALYYLALRFSFVFASVAITAGVAFASVLNNLTGAAGSVSEKGSNAENSVRGMGGPESFNVSGNHSVFGWHPPQPNIDIPNPMNGIANMAGSLVGMLTAIAIVVVCIFLCALTAIPMFETGKGKVSLMELLVQLPYMLADTASDRIDQLVRNMYGSTSNMKKSMDKAGSNSPVARTGRNLGEAGKNMALAGVGGVGGAMLAGADRLRGGDAAHEGFHPGMVDDEDRDDARNAVGANADGDTAVDENADGENVNPNDAEVTGVVGDGTNGYADGDDVGELDGGVGTGEGDVVDGDDAVDAEGNDGALAIPTAGDRVGDDRAVDEEGMPVEGALNNNMGGDETGVEGDSDPNASEQQPLPGTDVRQHAAGENVGKSGPISDIDAQKHPWLNKLDRASVGVPAAIAGTAVAAKTKAGDKARAVKDGAKNVAGKAKTAVSEKSQAVTSKLENSGKWGKRAVDGGRFTKKVGKGTAAVGAAVGGVAMAGTKKMVKNKTAGGLEWAGNKLTGKAVMSNMKSKDASTDYRMTDKQKRDAEREAKKNSKNSSVRDINQRNAAKAGVTSVGGGRDGATSVKPKSGKEATGFGKSGMKGQVVPSSRPQSRREDIKSRDRHRKTPQADMSHRQSVNNDQTKVRAKRDGDRNVGLISRAGRNYRSSHSETVENWKSGHKTRAVGSEIKHGYQKTKGAAQSKPARAVGRAAKKVTREAGRYTGKTAQSMFDGKNHVSEDLTQRSRDFRSSRKFNQRRR